MKIYYIFMNNIMLQPNSKGFGPVKGRTARKAALDLSRQSPFVRASPFFFRV